MPETRKGGGAPLKPRLLQAWRKSRRTVDGARKHGRKNYKQDRVEWSLARERPFVSEPHCDQCDKKDNDAAQRNLTKRQIFRLYAQAQQHFKRVPECIHRRHCTVARNILRAQVAAGMRSSSARW